MPVRYMLECEVCGKIFENHPRANMTVCQKNEDRGVRLNLHVEWVQRKNDYEDSPTLCTKHLLEATLHYADHLKKKLREEE